MAGTPVWPALCAPGPRRNRSFHAEGCSARPVLKTGCACGNGTYRIEWVFARNAAGAPVLRRNGNDTAERAVTQFPLT